MMNFLILNRNINVDKNKPAIVTKHTSINYLQFEDKLKNTCTYLQIKGIKYKSRVAINGRHTIDFVVMLFALWRMGAVPIPLNTRLNDKETAQLINIAKPDFILSDSECVIPDVYNPEDKDVLHLNDNDEGIVIFTSGTTGVPKGVVLTINNLLSSADITNGILNRHNQSPYLRRNPSPHPSPHPNTLPEGEGMSEGEGMPESNDKWLASLPFYHIGGIMVLIRAITAGLTVIIPDSFDIADISYCIKEFRPSFMSLVPTMMKRLLENNVYPNPEMKCVLLGGGPVSPELARKSILKGWEVLKVYGASETCSMFTALNLNKNMDRLASAGRPLDNNRLKIVDENDEVVPAGQTGEIILSGSTIFKEYLNNIAETKRKKYNGFYHTGDIGYVDDAGYLYILSRRADLIISGGENISPIEIEQAIMSIPGVLQVCVVGIPDEEWGQIPAAAIKTNTQLNSDYITDSLRKLVAGYKLPKRIIFLDEFPVNEMGKVNFDKLKNYFQ